MKKVESYLLTMELTVGLTLHSLVMTNDIKDLDKIITAMRVKSKELAAKLGRRNGADHPPNDARRRRERGRGLLVRVRSRDERSH